VFVLCRQVARSAVLNLAGGLAVRQMSGGIAPLGGVCDPAVTLPSMAALDTVYGAELWSCIRRACAVFQEFVSSLVRGPLDPIVRRHHGAKDCYRTNA
jgi:hypothetical protein